MSSVLRITAIRLLALVGLAVSALLAVDHFRPGPAFCPLEEACATARESDLGSFGGVPTSLLGIAAFGMLMLLTLPSPARARRLLIPVGFFSLGAGLAFVIYQAVILGSFCPLCVVADAAAFVAGLIAITWWTPPSHRRSWGPGEAMGTKVAWVLGAALAVTVPFALPRDGGEAFEEAPALSDDALLALDAGPDANPWPTTTLADLENEASQVPPPALPRAPTGTTTPAPVPARTSAPAPSRTTSPRVPPAPATTPTGPKPPPTAPATRPPAPTQQPPARTATPPARTAPVQPVVRPIRVVEYLNAYCKHCRRTHDRLEQILETFPHPVEVRRVYTWRGNEHPLWARACAWAADQGREEALFRELLKARNQRDSEVYAAVKRAGLSVSRLRQAMRSTRRHPRLLVHQRLQNGARLKGLPTLDIGRRRLMGEQQTPALLAALRAAKAALQGR